MEDSFENPPAVVQLACALKRPGCGSSKTFRANSSRCIACGGPIVSSYCNNFVIAVSRPAIASASRLVVKCRGQWNPFAHEGCVTSLRTSTGNGQVPTCSR
eukprot:3939547-Rhodomonas_salina.1